MGPYSLIKTEANRKLAQANAAKFGYFKIIGFPYEVAVMTAQVLFAPKPYIDVVLISRQEIESGESNTDELLGVRLKVKKLWFERFKGEDVVFTENTVGFVENVVDLLNITGLDKVGSTMELSE